jgi:ribulose-phosphate 3-epimerase
MSVRVGVGLSCLESPDLLEQFDEQFDFVQVMGIEHIGKQGEPLSQKALYLLERLRHRYPTMTLQIDGGVRQENIKDLMAAGATSIVSGSAILGADDPHAAYAALYNIANGL